MRLPNETGHTRLIVRDGYTKTAESCLYYSGLLYERIEHGFDLYGKHVPDFSLDLLRKLKGYGVRAKLQLSFLGARDG